jgi:hypothetical protein
VNHLKSKEEGPADGQLVVQNILSLFVKISLIYKLSYLVNPVGDIFRPYFYVGFSPGSCSLEHFLRSSKVIAAAV